MIDPTYEKNLIDANPEWKLAFQLSEIDNDEAPLGWGKYRAIARYLLAEYDLRPVAAAPAPDAELVALPVWRHVRRGTTYRQVGHASLQCTEGCGEGAVLVIYQGDDGQMWARPYDEFHDGRFERVADAAAAIRRRAGERG